MVSIMKLSPALTLLALAAPALAQTGSQTARPPVHHTATHRAATGACADSPVLSPDIPKVPGCPKTLYALKYIDTVIGTGPLAEPMKLYSVHYTGYLLDGKKFDSSLDRKEPITFPVGMHRVIVGWDTGFAGMHVGGKRRLFIPYQLAYGDAGRPPVIPAKATLIFDLELLDQKDLPQQPARTPGTPGAPPAGQPRPATPPVGSTPPASTTPPPAPGAIPTPPPAGTPGTTTPGTTPKPVDPTKPTTVPPPTDPTKPAATPPSTAPSN